MKGQLIYRSALVVVMLAVAAGIGAPIAGAAPPSPPWFTNGNAGTNPTTNFLGTTDSAALALRTNSLERLRITGTGNVGIGTDNPLAKFHVLTAGSQTGVNGSSGSGLGVSGNSGTGTGVLGSSFSGPGVNGSSGTGTGVLGSGRAFGVAGTSTTGTGVHGESENGTGMHGVSNSGTGTGVLGSGGLYGVSGTSTIGYGVHGESDNGYGVGGKSDSGLGVTGSSDSSLGVAGSSSSGTGVMGFSTLGTGVRGLSDSSFGVRGESPSTGVYGTSDSGFGVAGTSDSGYAVSGLSDSGPGVFGASLSGWAGYFVSDVLVTGNLSKGGGSFKIDHPLDPQNKYLYHSFVESPDMMNIYNGNVTTDANGDATVTLPDWFEVLNKDFRYQLTIMGEQFSQARVSSKIKDNRFTIKTDKPNVEVSWQVTGIRHDPYAEANRIPVEEDKPADEKGKYLHPTEWGRPESAGIDYEERQKMREELQQAGER